MAPFRRAVVMFAGLLLLAWDAPSPSNIRSLHARGWIKDGRWFAWETLKTGHAETGEDLGSDIYTAIETRTGERRTFKSSSAFDRWEKEHPLQEAFAEQLHQGLRAKVEPVGQNNIIPDKGDPLPLAKDPHVGWVSAIYGVGWPVPNEGDGLALDVVSFDLSVVREGRASATVRSCDLSSFGAGMVRAAVEAFFSPGGSRVVWLVSGQSARAGSPSEGCMLLSAVGPSVQVLAHASFPKEKIDPALDALEKADLWPIKVARAQERRAQSVVFTDKEFAADAARAAAAVPGGAKVEPLTWQTDADLVVALGDSAGK